ncbi:MAG: hypothetical protein C0475_09045 [Planctomyces sp.]|nr:hypothetical protein [Planctomyces sp.]MBA4040059.1 hypothetical protein [Planctomyces sp.]MBA4120177.1 hypothetical protein [Isosphaera sp.]
MKEVKGLGEMAGLNGRHTAGRGGGGDCAGERGAGAGAGGPLRRRRGGLRRVGRVCVRAWPLWAAGLLSLASLVLIHGCAAVPPEGAELAEKSLAQQERAFAAALAGVDVLERALGHTIETTAGAIARDRGDYAADVREAARLLESARLALVEAGADAGAIGGVADGRDRMSDYARRAEAGAAHDAEDLAEYRQAVAGAASRLREALRSEAAAALAAGGAVAAWLRSARDAEDARDSAVGLDLTAKTGEALRAAEPGLERARDVAGRLRELIDAVGRVRGDRPAEPRGAR